MSKQKNRKIQKLILEKLKTAPIAEEIIVPSKVKKNSSKKKKIIEEQKKFKLPYYFKKDLIKTSLTSIFILILFAGFWYLDSKTQILNNFSNNLFVLFEKS